MPLCRLGAIWSSLLLSALTLFWDCDRATSQTHGGQAQSHDQGKVKTIRDGQEVALNPEELVLGDVIRLSAGEQIPSDALVLEGFAEVNEAMLTGESDLVQKEVDGLLLSGSF